MRGAKGVVDVDLAQPGQLSGELGVVGRLPGMKAQVFEHQHLARLQGLGHCFGFGPHAIRSHGHGTTQQLRQSIRGRLERQLRHDLALGFSGVGHEHQRRTLVQGQPQGFQATADASVVLHHPVLERNVVIHANQHPFACNIHGVEKYDAHLPYLCSIDCSSERQTISTASSPLSG